MICPNCHGKKTITRCGFLCVFDVPCSWCKGTGEVMDPQQMPQSQVINGLMGPPLTVQECEEIQRIQSTLHSAGSNT